MTYYIFSIDGPQSITLSPSNTSITVREGATITPIICKADCNPPCTFQWIHNSSTGDSVINGTVLNIESAQRSHNDTYRCEALARNPVPSQLQRRQSVDIRIDVQCKCRIIQVK